MNDSPNKSRFGPLSCVYGRLVIPQRFVLVIMLNLAATNSFNLKSVLEVIVEDLVLAPNNTVHQDICPQYTAAKSEKMMELHVPVWLSYFIGQTFFTGYMISQLPGGWLADKVGPKHVVAFCMLGSAILILLHPVVVTYGGFQTALASRIALGLLQGPTLPCYASLLQRWTTSRDLTLLGGVAFGGSALGLFITNFFTGRIIQLTENWETPFFIYGSCTILWYAFSWCTVFGSPLIHPFITENELEYFEGEMERKKVFTVPWCKIFLSPAVWSFILIKFGDLYLTYNMKDVFSKYMKQVLKWESSAHSITRSLPFLVSWLTNFVFSWLGGHLVNKGVCTTLTIRKTYTVIGMVVSSLCMVIAIHLGCTRTGFIVLYFIAWFLKGSIFSSVVLNGNDLTRNYAGIVMALANGLGGTAGILQRWIMDTLTHTSTQYNWGIVIWTLFGICCTSTLVFIIFGKAERQPWDFPRDADDQSL